MRASFADNHSLQHGQIPLFSHLESGDVLEAFNFEEYLDENFQVGAEGQDFLAFTNYEADGGAAE